MSNEFMKYYAFCENKGLSLVFNNQVKLIDKIKNYTIYNIIDNNINYEVKCFDDIDLFGGQTCTCDLYTHNLYCPHTLASIYYKAKLHGSKLDFNHDSYDEINDYMHMDENIYDNIKYVFRELDHKKFGEFFNSILENYPDISDEYEDTFKDELPMYNYATFVRFFETVCDNYPKIYNEFIMKFRSVTPHYLFGEFGMLSLKYDRYDSFHEFYKDDYKKDICEFFSKVILTIKSELEIKAFINFVFDSLERIYFKSLNSDDYYNLYNSILYYVNNLPNLDIDLNTLIYKNVINLLSSTNKEQLIKSLGNYLIDYYFTDSYKEDIKNKIRELLTLNSKVVTNNIRNILSIVYLDILNKLELSTVDKVNELKYFVYSNQVLEEVVNDYILLDKYDDAIKIINESRHSIEDIVIIKNLLKVNKKFNKVKDVVNNVNHLLENHGYHESILDLKEILSDNEFNAYLNHFYNRNDIDQEIKENVACLLKDFDKLFEFVLNDDYGTLGLKYLDYLRKTKTKELLSYFENSVHNILERKKNSELYLIALSKILYCFDTIPGGGKYGVLLTEEVLKLNNPDINKLITGSVKKYLE